MQEHKIVSVADLGVGLSVENDVQSTIEYTGIGYSVTPQRLFFRKVANKGMDILCTGYYDGRVWRGDGPPFSTVLESGVGLGKIPLRVDGQVSDFYHDGNGNYTNPNSLFLLADYAPYADELLATNPTVHIRYEIMDGDSTLTSDNTTGVVNGPIITQGITFHSYGGDLNNLVIRFFVDTYHFVMNETYKVNIL